MIDVEEEVDDEVDVLDEDELHPPPPPPAAPTWIEGGTGLCVGITVKPLGGSVGIGCIGIDGMLPNGV